MPNLFSYIYYFNIMYHLLNKKIKLLYYLHNYTIIITVQTFKGTLHTFTYAHKVLHIPKI